MNKKELYTEVERLISGQLGISEDEVRRDASLVDLGADSLDIVELAMDAEDVFEIEIPDDDLWNRKLGDMTVNDAVEYIWNRRTGDGR